MTRCRLPKLWGFGSWLGRGGLLAEAIAPAGHELIDAFLPGDTFLLLFLLGQSIGLAKILFREGGLLESAELEGGRGGRSQTDKAYIRPYP